MTKKGFFCFLLFGLIACKLYAQVNLQTGSATFSLPIFNWQDDKSRLSSIVALSYNSGNGLQVGEISSNVGQGWNLITGGQIVRMQNDLPDDQVIRNGSVSDITKYPSGILYASTPAENGCPIALTKYPIYKSKNQIYKQHNEIAEDKQLDYFLFQFNGKTGMFVLDPANIGVAKSIGDSKMKITFQEDAGLVGSGIRTKITSFTIQDVDGLIYKFTKHGLTKVLDFGFSDDSYNYKQTQPKFKNDKVYYQSAFDNNSIVNPWIIGSWSLTEVEDALTHRKIYFNYTTRNINNPAGEVISANYSKKDYCIVSHSISITQTPDITSVVYPDGHSVTFNYGANRIDLNGAKALASIDVLYQGRFLSKHELNTTYFILNRYGTPSSDYQKKAARLCLRSVRKIGIDLLEDTPPYQFDYYLGSSAADDFVPPPFFYAKDIWGFYNGDYSKGKGNESIPLNTSINKIKNCNQLRGLCFQKDGVSGPYLNPKNGYAKNGLLKQILYPTGGTLTYQYQQNTGIINGASSVSNVGGVHVSSTSSTDGGYSNPCANPITTNYNYVLSGSSNPSLWGIEMPVNSMVNNNHYQPEKKYYHYSFPLGSCKWRFQYPGILSQQQSINLAGIQKVLAFLSPVFNVLSILSTIQDIVTVIGGGSPISLVIDAIIDIVEIAITCFGNGSRDYPATTYYSTNLNGASPLPTQFKRVEVTESPGTIGKTVQEFTSDDDYPIWEPTNPAFSAKQRFAPWAYGLPKRTIVYNENGIPVKETTNYYSYAENNCFGICPSKAKSPLHIKSVKCKVNKSISQRNEDWENINVYNDPNSYLTSSSSDLSVDIYDVYTGRVELDSNSTKIYSSINPSKFVETSTVYEYNSYYLPYLIKSMKSDGNRIDKYIKYPFNYTGGAISVLNQNNIITTPISTFTYIHRPQSAEVILNENITEFTQLSNGDIKPLQTLEHRFSQPQDANSVSLYAGPGSNLSSYKITQQFQYDASGNLIGVKDEGNRQLTNIYDYNDKYVAASVINADPVTDLSGYTSFETTSLGGWAISGAVITNSNAITGSKSLTLTSSSTIYKTLNTAKPYAVSFWASNSSIVVTGGATLIKSAPTLNGFTYYEYDIVQGTSYISLTGNCNLDEIRAYPKTARMRTVTYDPIIGKTSECDENNRITYYEYDKLGRLQFIKDEKKNIVKTYEYNNVSTAKQNGCPGIYYNNLVSEVFTKNNCGAGYLGSDVTYTIPANTYSSLISQQDADAKAESAILANGQNYANNNGTCNLLYYNTHLFQNFMTENCEPGYVGGTVSYAIPPGRYSSTISQADANQKALDEIEANGQANANLPANQVCIVDNNPVWESLDGAPTYCQSVNGNLPPHLFVLVTDINPNSATYNQTQWVDVGESDLCPPGNYYNTLQSQSFTRNNCPAGYSGSTVTYTVQPGTYSSTVSQAAANQLATNNINANGQAYANANGTCINTCTSCTGNDKKCINNVCETGVWGVVSSFYYQIPGHGAGTWECTWRYCFSDGSQSTYSQTTFSSTMCFITCEVGL